MYSFAIMSVKAVSNDSARAYVKLLQNPYASLSVYDLQAEEPDSSPKISVKSKQSRLREMQNPYAYLDFDDGSEADKVEQPTLSQAVISFPAVSDLGNKPPRQKPASHPSLEKELDDMLKLYRPYVARSEWALVTEYRSKFLELAARTPTNVSRVIERLQKLKFSLMPNEKVENNRAPAKRIISELEKLLA